MTECNRQTYLFQPENRRQVVAKFTGGEMSSDGGLLLVRELERRSGILERFSQCFRDHRNEEAIRFSVKELVSQRVYGLIAGYEDVNDHEHLRNDPIFQVTVGSEKLAGKSTLNRLENGKGFHASKSARYSKIELVDKRAKEYFVQEYLREVRKPPKQIIIDVDANDVRLYGEQEQRYYRANYGGYCYLPLSLYIGDHLVYTYLQPSSGAASSGTIEALEVVIPAIRKKHPKANILIRADGGFSQDEIMSWCENRNVNFVFGLPKNSRLIEVLAPELTAAEAEHQRTGAPVRFFSDFRYQTNRSWSRERRVIGKAEHLEGGPNPRFIVTSLPCHAIGAKTLYEQCYCARGDMENRIKEQLQLFSDRLSVHTFFGNQVRLYFSAVAYVMFAALRRKALKGTQCSTSYFDTLRLRLIKIGALITKSVRRFVVEFPAAFPFRTLFEQAHKGLVSS